MYNYTIRTIACILLVSHTLMSCFNSELAIPSKEYSLEEKAHYLETSIDTQVTTDSVDGERVGYYQGISLQQPRLDIQPFTQGITLSLSPTLKQAPSIADLQIDLPVLKLQFLNSTSDIKNQAIALPFIQSETQSNPLLPISKRQRTFNLQEKVVPINSIERIRKPHIRLHTCNQLQKYQQHTQAKRRSKETKVIQEKYVEKEKLKGAKQPDRDLSVVPRNISPTYCFDKQIAAQLQLLNRILQGNRQGHYQLARVQENLISFHQLIIGDRFLTAPIQIRGGHQVRFTQDAGYWWGILQENCAPGFSRTLTLPVLYPQNRLIELGRQLEYTVESLLNASPEAQRQLLHVIFPEQIAQKIGFLYIGREMGVMGGGWGSFWKAVGIGIAAAAVGAAVVASGGTLVIGISIFGLSVSAAVGVAVFAVAVGAGAFVYLTQRDLERRKELINEIKGFVAEREGVEKGIVNSIESILTEIKKNPRSYEKTVREGHLKRLEDYESSVKDSIRELESYKENKANKDILFEDDLKDIASHIEAREKKLRHIKNKIQEAKKIFREQALAAFEQDKNAANNSIKDQVKELTKSIHGITAPDGLYDADINTKAMANLLSRNIGMYEKWKDEPALFEQDRKLINVDLETERRKAQEHELTRQLIGYVKKNTTNAQKIQEIAQATDPTELLSKCKAAINNGELFIIAYLINFKDLILNKGDIIGNTPLHQAVIKNKPAIVAYLLRHHADKSLKNGDGETPLDLATDPVIKKLLEENL